jgi:hypothetical protein
VWPLMAPLTALIAVISTAKATGLLVLLGLLIGAQKDGRGGFNELGKTPYSQVRHMRPRVDTCDRFPYSLR